MITFKTLDDLNQLSISNKAYNPIKTTFEQLVSAYTAIGHPYSSREHGYVVLVEEGDYIVTPVIPELPVPLAEGLWEGVYLKNGFFYGVVLIDNEFGISFLIPDESWLDSSVRASLEAQLTT